MFPLYVHAPPEFRGYVKRGLVSRSLKNVLLPCSGVQPVRDEFFAWKIFLLLLLLLLLLTRQLKIQKQIPFFANFFILCFLEIRIRRILRNLEKGEHKEM